MHAYARLHACCDEGDQQATRATVVSRRETVAGQWTESVSAPASHPGRVHGSTVLLAVYKKKKGVVVVVRPKKRLSFIHCGSGGGRRRGGSFWTWLSRDETRSRLLLHTITLEPYTVLTTNVHFVFVPIAIQGTSATLG